MTKPSVQLGKSLSLRFVLIVPFVLQIFAAVGLVGYLSFRNGQKAVNDLALRLQNEVSDRVDQHLDGYLNTARHLARGLGDTVDTGLLDPQDKDKVRRYFWKQMQIYNIGYIGFAFKSGDFAAAGRLLDDGRVTVDEVSPQKYGNSHNYIYETDIEGNRTKQVLDLGNYAFEKESWYADTARLGKSMWSSVYQWQMPPYTLSVSANRPVYDKNKNLIGVIGVDQRLTQISDFLQQLRVSQSGTIFILEQNGLIIGTSGNEKVFTLVNNKEPKRLKATDSDNPLIQATAKHLIKQFGSFDKIKDNRTLEFSLNNQRQFVQVKPWKDDWGLDWLVVVAGNCEFARTNWF
ncbi:MAG: cache domain-containing protein [Cyanomargarita calcarea GSE-NOS-MK-12-04C]|jgi:hypothetical protein|uniref:Cache domain-containing protein n=1 Tax=Cyanomargarita calcarea GSE-NOS-MK-12-04C TaxID=2839659 RepID=A0A951UQY2_9CYAN|nr:cache domain-containing protein [Cyanomargarita calcarea GSE-NOS-MK-12-04C]